MMIIHKTKSFIVNYIFFGYLLFALAVSLFSYNDYRQTPALVPQWDIFLIWGLNLLICSGIVLYKVVRKDQISRLFAWVRREKYTLLLLFVLAAFTRLVLLESYPYVSVGDELRDPGFYALQIKTGQITDLFGYIGSVGNFVPLAGIIFSTVFENSVLSFRLLNAFIGVSTILLTYGLASYLFHRKIALISSLLMIASLFSLH